MNGKTVPLIVGGLLLAGAAFAGGYFLSARNTTARDPRAAFANLTQAEREQMQNMTAEERQAFLQEKGIDMPAGGPGGAPGDTTGANRGSGGFGGPGGGAQVLEGTVDGIAEDKLSLTIDAGGSAKVYIDDATIIGAVDGKKAELATGAEVLVVAKPEATGVTAATAILIK